MHFCFLSAEWLFNFWRFHLGKGTQMAVELIREAYWIVQIPVSNLLYIRLFIQFWDSWFLQPATKTKQSRLPPNLGLKILEIVTIPMKCSHASSVWKHQKYWRTVIALYPVLWHSNIQSTINVWNSQKTLNFELNIEILSGILPRNCHDVKEFHGPGLVDHAGRKVQPGRIHDGFMDGSRKVIFLAFFVNFVKFQFEHLKIEIQLDFFWMNSKQNLSEHEVRSFPTKHFG